MKKWLVITIGFLFCTSQLCVGYAITWRDLWSRPDQQAANALRHGQPGKAADLFHNPHWRAVAQYRSGHYQQVIDNLAKFNTDSANYNRGNALAHLGRFQQAIQAYDQAIRLNPHNQDAKYNKKLLEQLIKKQKKQHRSKSSSQSNQSQHKRQPQQTQHNKQQSSQTQSKQQQHKTTNKVKQKHPGDQKQAVKHQSSPFPKTHKHTKGKTNTSQAKTKQTRTDKQRQATSTNTKPLTKAQQRKLAQQARQHAATKRWLNQFPDNPGGLLRNKFLRDYQRMIDQGKTS